ncbi:unnamed protein product [Heterobilharzia americana]|nr:unnamed protein product [Heterobilharzia americana]
MIHLYRASVRNRRQMHIRSVKHTWWRPKSGRRSAKRSSYKYKHQIGKEKTSLSGGSESPEAQEQADEISQNEPIKKIQSLAEDVRDEKVSLEEIQPILYDIAKEMVQGIIQGSEEKILKFMELLEQDQDQISKISDSVDYVKPSVSFCESVEIISRQSSKLSETSAQELTQAFINNLTENVSVYLEDILDELLVNNEEEMNSNNTQSNRSSKSENDTS